jgi:hypothetical protein
MKKTLKIVTSLLLAVSVSACSQTYQTDRIVFADGDTLEKGVIEQGAQSTGAWKYTDAQTGASKLDVVNMESMPARVIPAVTGGMGAAAVTGVFQTAITKMNNDNCRQGGCQVPSPTPAIGQLVVQGAQAVANATTTSSSNSGSTGPCGPVACAGKVIE